MNEATRPSHLLDALVETVAKRQGLKATRQGHLIEALVEVIAKLECPEASWQQNVINVLIEFVPKDEALREAPSRPSDPSMRIPGQALSGWGLVPEVTFPVKGP